LTWSAICRMATLKSEASSLHEVAGFILDMDGVIYRGAAVLPGAVAFIAGLHASRIPFVYLTNNSTTPPQAVAARLAGMGVTAAASEVITSAEATASAVANEMPGCRVLLLGEAGIRQALLAEGCSLVQDHREADAVVVGLDRECTYAALREATLAVRQGAPFFATNSDRTLPTEIGLIPGAGALVGALELATDVQARVIGKPSPEIFRYALARLGTAPERTAVIGDRPETDIVGGQLSGLRTIAVLSGVGTRSDFGAMPCQPDWVFCSLSDLSEAYFEWRNVGGSDEPI
jgi:4-nitrophenyl phosphatase